MDGHWRTTKIYAICEVAFKSSNDPQFPEYLKVKAKKERPVLWNIDGQKGQFIDNKGKTRKFAYL